MGLTRPPMIRADHKGTKPAPGVIATRPTTKPVEAPTRVGFLFLITSRSIQVSRAAAAETADVINAWAARPSAFRALPALKPNQPNQSIPAPSITKGIL